mgnify:CR=1 FL=1
MGELIYLTPELTEIGPCGENIDFDVGEDNASNDFTSCIENLPLSLCLPPAPYH